MQKYSVPNLPRNLQQIIDKQKKSWFFATIIMTICCIVGFILSILTIFESIRLFAFYLLFFIPFFIIDFWFWRTYKHRSERKWIIDYLKSKNLMSTPTEIELLREFDSCWNKDFVLTESIEIVTNEMSESFLLMDNNNQIFIYQKGVLFSKKYSFSDLIGYEVIENGNIKLQRYANKQPLKATSNAVSNETCSKANETCTQLILILHLNDLESPKIIISYIDVLPCEKSSQDFQKMEDNISHVCAVLDFILYGSTIEQSPNHSDEKRISTMSSCKEQLQELMDLLNEGLITQEDYEQKKKQILGL